MKASALAVATAAIFVMLSAAPAAAAVQTLSFGGVLDYGSNNSAGSTFAAEGTNLMGKTYTVTFSYDPALFTAAGASSCGAAPNTSCSFFFTAARPATETVTIGNTTRTFQLTAGSMDLSSGGAGGADNFGFNFTSGLSFSGYFQDGNGFFPNQNSVNQPIFSNFSNLSVSFGTFQQNGTGYSFGDNPSALSATYSAGGVPEPATWAMLIAGFGLTGAAMRRRRGASRSLA